MPTTPPSPEALALSHGQARWVLQGLRLGRSDDDARLDAWLKYLRREGVPFDPEELGIGTGRNLVYRFEHLMELALAMVLRSTGLLDQHTVQLLALHRSRLRACYWTAWHERESGRGAPVMLTAGSWRLLVSGLHLSLHTEVLASGVLSSTAPRLLEPLEAMEAFGAHHQTHYPRPPIPLSDLATDIVRLAEVAPPIRRGRPRGS